MTYPIQGHVENGPISADIGLRGEVRSGQGASQLQG